MKIHILIPLCFILSFAVNITASEEKQMLLPPDYHAPSLPPQEELNYKEMLTQMNKYAGHQGENYLGANAKITAFLEQMEQQVEQHRYPAYVYIASFILHSKATNATIHTHPFNMTQYAEKLFKKLSLEKHPLQLEFSLPTQLSFLLLVDGLQYQNSCTEHQLIDSTFEKLRALNFWAKRDPESMKSNKVINAFTTLLNYQKNFIDEAVCRLAKNISTAETAWLLSDLYEKGILTEEDYYKSEDYKNIARELTEQEYEQKTSHDKNEAL